MKMRKVVDSVRNNIKLSVAYIQYYKKQAFILFLGICMSALVIDGIMSLIYSNYMADFENAKKEFGSWNYTIKVPENKEKDVMLTGNGYTIESFGIYRFYKREVNGKSITFCYGDKNYYEMTGRKLLEGKYPENSLEIALDYYSIHNLDIDYEIGSILELSGKRYVLTGIMSEGTYTDDNSIKIFTGEDFVKTESKSIYYLKFSEKSSAYEQFSAFLQKNHMKYSDSETNDGIASYIGAEPKESVFDIIRTALHLKSGKLIYMLGTLEYNVNILQKMIFAVLCLFGIFIIFSIYQVIIEKRLKQIGLLEVLGMDEKNLFIYMLTELLILFVPAYLIGGLVGNCFAKLLYAGKFHIHIRTFVYSFVFIFLSLILCCAKNVYDMYKLTQIDKMGYRYKTKDRRIICQKRHNLTGILSKRFILSKKTSFLGIIISLSLGGVLVICTTYVSDNATQNSEHSLETDDALYTDIRAAIEDDDLGKIIPKEIVKEIKKDNIEGIEDVFPISYTLGEIPFNNGIFKWTDFYPEIASQPTERQNEKIMEKYNGIATKQSESDYKLKVNVYGYEKQEISRLSDYLLKGDLDPHAMVRNNQVILKTLMDGAGYYDGIEIEPGDHIQLKVPKDVGNSDRDLLKFQSPDVNYVEKDFTVCAIVSRCIGETDAFIGSGTDVVSIVMPQEMMESNFGMKDYNSVNIDIEPSADSQKIVRKLRPYFIGLNKCLISDYSFEITRKKEMLKQKVYFFYGIAIILYFISMLHVVNTMRHQIWTRRHEFGILRAIGITEERFFGILMKEGIFYGFFTSISMIILTIFFKMVLSEIMVHIVRYITVSRNIPAVPLIMMTAVNFACCVLTMMLSGNKLLKENAIDELIE